MEHYHSDRRLIGSASEVGKDPYALLCNIEAEQKLLGSLLIDNRLFEHVADILAAEDFVNALHARIYRAISTMIGTGATADPITLRSYFDKDEALAELGGANYLGALARGAGLSSNARFYAQSISDLARRRDVVAAAQDILADAALPDPARAADIVIDEAEEKLFAIADRKNHAGAPVALDRLASSAVTHIEQAHRDGGAVTVDTGLAGLDAIISGMGAGDMCVLAARPGMGKTALAGSVAIFAARRGKRVALFSLEMTGEELAGRWIAGLTGISTDRQRHGKIEHSEWQGLIDAQAELGRLPIFIDDQPRLSVAQMRQRCRRMRRRTGLDLVIIDHLQLVRQGGKQESRRLEIGDASSMIKAIAKELGVPFLVLSQLSRAVEQRDDKRPILSDLRESGDIEQDADVVMFLYRDEYYLQRAEPRRRPSDTADGFASKQADWTDALSAAKGLAEIIVAKNRHGRNGVAKAYFDGERQTFTDLARGY